MVSMLSVKGDGANAVDECVDVGEKHSYCTLTLAKCYLTAQLGFGEKTTPVVPRKPMPGSVVVKNSLFFSSPKCDFCLSFLRQLS